MIIEHDTICEFPESKSRIARTKLQTLINPCIRVQISFQIVTLYVFEERHYVSTVARVIFK